MNTPIVNDDPVSRAIERYNARRPKPVADGSQVYNLDSNIDTLGGAISSGGGGGGGGSTAYLQAQIDQLFNALILASGSGACTPTPGQFTITLTFPGI